MLLLLWGRDSAEVCFVCDGKIVFSRNVKIAVSDFFVSGPSDVGIVSRKIEKAADLLQETIDLFRAGVRNVSPERIVLLAEQNLGDLLKGNLFSFLGIPVEVADPLKKTSELSAVFKKELIPATSILGFIFHGNCKMDFLPNVLKSEQETQKKIFPWSRLIGAIVVLGVLVHAFLAVKINNKQSYLKKMNVELMATAKDVVYAEHEIKFAEYMKENVYSDIVPSIILRNIFECTPDDMEFVSLKMQKSGLISLSGMTNRNVLEQLMANFKSNSFFSEIYLQEESIVGSQITFHIDAQTNVGGAHEEG